MVADRMRARAVVVLPALLAALAAGCGSAGAGDRGRDDYARALNQAQDGLTRRFTALQDRIAPTSTAAQDVRTLRAYEAAVGTTVRDLRAIDPPDGLAALHRRFVGQVAGYGVALRAARARLEDGGPRGILAAQGRLKEDVAAAGRRLDATIAQINEKLQG
jgi:hypothetical protein